MHSHHPSRFKPRGTAGRRDRRTASFAGLSGEDILVNLSARADVTAVCINPGSGGQQPPGQNPAPITVTGSEPIPVTKIKNGNTDFDVKTLARNSHTADYSC